MSRSFRFLCGLWAAWLVACQNAAPLTPTAAPQSTPSAAIPATLVPRPTPTPTPSLWASAPLTIPDDIPLPPNAFNLRGINDPAADTADFLWPNPEGRFVVLFELSDSVETGQAFYANTLPALGWTLVQTTTYADGWRMVYRKEGVNELTGYRQVQVTWSRSPSDPGWGVRWWTFPAIPWRADMPVPTDAVAYEYHPENRELTFYYYPSADVPAQLETLFTTLWDGWLAQGWEFQHGPNYRAEGLEWQDDYDFRLRPTADDQWRDCAGTATAALPWRDTPEGRVPCEIEGYFKMDRPSTTGWTNALATIWYTSDSSFVIAQGIEWVVEVRVAFTTY